MAFGLPIVDFSDKAPTIKSDRIEFCITSDLGKPRSLENSSEQKTTGKSTIWALHSRNPVQIILDEIDEIFLYFKKTRANANLHNTSGLCNIICNVILTCFLLTKKIVCLLKIPKFVKWKQVKIKSMKLQRPKQMTVDWS